VLVCSRSGFYYMQLVLCVREYMQIRLSVMDRGFVICNIINFSHLGQLIVVLSTQIWFRHSLYKKKTNIPESLIFDYTGCARTPGL